MAKGITTADAAKRPTRAERLYGHGLKIGAKKPAPPAPKAAPSKPAPKPSRPLTVTKKAAPPPKPAVQHGYNVHHAAAVIRQNARKK